MPRQTLLGRANVMPNFELEPGLGFLLPSSTHNMTADPALFATHTLVFAMGIGVQEMLVIFFILLMLSVPAIVAVVIVLFVARKANRSASSPAPVPSARSREERLAELDGLLAQSLITEAEYQTQRERILGEL